jgi:glycosyltransferase involved in cell wall biosynthesis
MFFSIIIPLFNRPQEIKELLQTLVEQTYKDFEVLVIEDGSSIDAAEVVKSFANQLNQTPARVLVAIMDLNAPKAITL